MVKLPTVYCRKCYEYNPERQYRYKCFPCLLKVKDPGVTVYGPV